MPADRAQKDISSGKNSTGRAKSSKSPTCTKCGRIGHTLDTCRTKICTYCDLKGHLESDCYRKQNADKKKEQAKSHKTATGSGVTSTKSGLVASALADRELELQGMADMLRDVKEEILDIYEDTPRKDCVSLQILDMIPAESGEQVVHCEPQSPFPTEEQLLADESTFRRLRDEEEMLRSAQARPIEITSPMSSWWSVVLRSLVGTLVTAGVGIAARRPALFVAGIYNACMIAIHVCGVFMKRTERYEVGEIDDSLVDGSSRPDSQSLGATKHEKPLVARVKYTLRELDFSQVPGEVFKLAVTGFLPCTIAGSLQLTLLQTTVVSCGLFFVLSKVLGLRFGMSTKTREFPVSLEAASQVSTNRELNLASEEKVAWEKINRSLVSLHSVNYKRFWVLDQDFVLQGTAVYAFGLYRAMRKKFDKLPFPKPLQR